MFYTPGRGGAVRVLVADDDLLLREMLEAELCAAGYDVVTAADGLEAWDILQREHIRMLVVDWMMPGQDGATLIRRIRAAELPGYTYIVLLTARSGSDHVVEGLNCGADDFVSKPFSSEELLARLGVGRRILDLEARLSASLAREEALATRDSLTGLPNRRGLHARAQEELSRAAREQRSVGVIMLDLDHFKKINDRFGHAAGDAALRRVAEVLQENRRDYDLTARWGGEEFLLVIPGANLEQARLVAERVRAAIQSIELRVAGSETLTLRASLGVAAAEPSAAPVTLDELLARADDAMYRAKREGRNRVRLQELPGTG
jgi:two-component system cell cycle response regulator